MARGDSLAETNRGRQCCAKSGPGLRRRNRSSPRSRLWFRHSPSAPYAPIPTPRPRRNHEDFSKAASSESPPPNATAASNSTPRLFEVQMTLAEGCAFRRAGVFGVMGVHNCRIALFDSRRRDDVWRHDELQSDFLSFFLIHCQGRLKRVDGGSKLKPQMGFFSERRSITAQWHSWAPS